MKEIHNKNEPALIKLQGRKEEEMNQLCEYARIFLDNIAKIMSPMPKLVLKNGGCTR